MGFGFGEGAHTFDKDVTEAEQASRRMDIAEAAQRQSAESDKAHLDEQARQFDEGMDFKQGEAGREQYNLDRSAGMEQQQRDREQLQRDRQFGLETRREDRSDAEFGLKQDQFDVDSGIALDKNDRENVDAAWADAQKEQEYNRNQMELDKLREAREQDQRCIESQRRTIKSGMGIAIQSAFESYLSGKSGGGVLSPSELAALKEDYPSLSGVQGISVTQGRDGNMAFSMVTDDGKGNAVQSVIPGDKAWNIISGTVNPEMASYYKRKLLGPEPEQAAKLSEIEEKARSGRAKDALAMSKADTDRTRYALDSAVKQYNAIQAAVSKNHLKGASEEQDKALSDLKTDINNLRKRLSGDAGAAGAGGGFTYGKKPPAAASGTGYGAGAAASPAPASPGRSRMESFITGNGVDLNDGLNILSRINGIAGLTREERLDRFKRAIIQRGKMLKDNSQGNQ